MIDTSKLDDYGAVLFEEIIRRHPEWLEMAENGNPDFETGFTISIYGPVKDKPPIKIFGGGGPEGLAIDFGDSFVDYHDIPQLGNPAMFYPNIDEVSDTIDDVVKKWLDYQRVLSEWKAGKK